MDFSLSDQNISDQVNRDLAEQQAQANSMEWNFPYIHLAEYPVNLDMLQFFSQQEAKESRLFAFDKKIKNIRIASYSPVKNQAAKVILENFQQQGYQISLYICSPESFAESLQKYDSRLIQRKKMDIRQSFTETSLSLPVIRQKFLALAPSLTEQTIPSVITSIELIALEAEASDIHWQPDLNGDLTIRIRVDGVLHEMLSIHRDLATKFVTKIKYDAGMKSNITDQPQDGRIQLVANKRSIELRVSTLPMTHCESVVMRILDSYKSVRSFHELGFTPKVQEEITSALSRKMGIILVTGPTGSGKTTTLYSMLKELNTSDQKLVTLEDPVEYHLERVTQSEVNEAANYTFSTGFKALLRHDPDVILVGEIRTKDTANLAFEAALTGHTVLTSLHSNHAIGAITRLRNMELGNHRIAPTVNAIFAQRLIRQLRPEAVVVKESLEVVMKRSALVANSVARFKKIFPNHQIPNEINVDTQNPDEDFLHREAVAEVIIMDVALQKHVIDGSSEIEIRHYLETETEYASLMVQALFPLFAGRTTWKELRRVLGA